MSHELAQDQTRFEKIKRIARKSALPAAIGVGILFPTAVYADTAINEEVTPISEKVSDLSDNSTAHTLEAVAIATGLAMTGSAYFTGKRWDEKRLHTLRVAGPVLLTASATATFIDSIGTINYAIPSGFAYASTIAFGATNIISTFERYRDKNIRAFSVATGAMLMTAGAAIFLAAADKINLP